MTTTTKEITQAGVLSGLAIVLGFFTHFTIGLGEIYLVGIILFMMPILLKWNFALISISVSVILVDILSGWAYYSWISFIAYGSGGIILILFKKLKSDFFYIIALIIASIWIIFSYYILELSIFGYIWATRTLLGNIIQFSIVLPLSIIIYKIISKSIFKF